jgi:serine/threonine protein phosphatase PrpC
MTPTHFICANAGDSRAILVQKKRVLPLSFDHKPTDPPEEARIVAAGGKVSIKRVDGDLAVSRGLGDFSFKNRPDLPPDQQKVTCCPEILVEPRQSSQDEFIILACDGIWDVASNESCAKLVHAILDEGETDIGLVCEEILDTCLERDSRDNMTVAMVTLPAIQMSYSNSNTSTSSFPIANFFKRSISNSNGNSSMNSSQSNDKKVGVWARRAKRQAKQAPASASGTTQKQTIITTNNKI